MSDQPMAASRAAAPEPGYYPDPSVPGFVRYWNGGTWVPGTSRPAPGEGEVLPPPPFADRPAARPNARYIPPPAVPSPTAAPEPAVVVSGEEYETGPVFLDETGASAVFTLGPAAQLDGPGWRADPQEQRGLLETGGAPRWVSWGVAEDTGAHRAAGAPGAGGAPIAGAGPAFTPASAPEPAPAPAPAPAVSASAPAPVVGHGAGSAPVAGHGAGSAPVAVSGAGPAPVAGQVFAPPVVRGPGPLPPVHRTSAPPTSQAQAAKVQAAPPAGIGRRALARLVDLVPLAAVGTAVGLPLATQTSAYLQQKLDQARTVSQLTRREVDVWLVDGTVLGRVALLLGALLLAGLLLEVLPTARTGRTLGKRLLGLRVVSVGTRQPPGAGRACGRWLVGQLLLVTVLGLAGLAAWPDKVARTTVVRG
ncbi:RDD family protein [Kitasatospora sp. RB6PN24]|uniref:RDD family protein n=1 Tax=Kitasatospora humi TaxID=2893891 RepID=UPI001E2894EC|nr:RDD family protein [Kitasatospora humi]MCC9308549.1 RDD family protein [Kitasatospora humi]